MLRRRITLSASYFAPTDLDEALALLQTREVAVVAGGTDVFPARGRAPNRSDLLDLTRIAGLRGIDGMATGALRIGAATTWADIQKADLPPAFDGLRAAAREVGGVQIQNTGTVAGNLCNASPAADGVPPLLSLDAEVELASARATRRIPLASFLTGPRQTALMPDEIMVALHIPATPAHGRGAFEKTGARRYLVISIVMTAVLIGLDAAGRIDVARVAVGAASPTAQRLFALERDMIGARPRDVEVQPQHLAPLAPIDDVRADRAYRLDIVPQQVRRALIRAATADG